MKTNRLNELIDSVPASGQRTLSEVEAKEVLAAAGLAVATAYLARSADEAAAKAVLAGYPVAIKVVSPEASHKSDVGGVVLGLQAEAQVREAFDRVRLALERARPDARFEGVAVQAMAPPGLDLFVGAKNDDRFGAQVIAGVGGIFLEVLGDTSLRLAPAGPAEALEMLSELQGAPLLFGVRGGPRLDVEALAGLISSISRLAADNPGLRELDLNPVRLYPKGFLVLDARALLARPAPSTREPEADALRTRRLANLARGFAARTVAVVGDKRANSYMWLHALNRFTGRLYSVQVDPNEIPEIEAMGVKNCRSLAEIAEPIDYAVVAVPRPVAPRILRDAIARQVGAISFFTSGFSETGEDLGRKLEAELKEIAGKSDIALVGPNCMGLVNPAIGLLNYRDQPVAQGGSACFISQSGTHTVNFCLQAPHWGVGVNKAASAGNVLILSAAEYLDVMAEDPATRVIGLYLEGVGDGRRLLASLRRAAARYPVFLWKGGTTAPGERATFSHTASLATARVLWQALVRQGGGAEVTSLDAMIDAMQVVLKARPLSGRRVGLVAMTGGQSVVITDIFANAGLEVPTLSEASYRDLQGFFNIVGGSYRNPLDAGGTIGTDLNQGILERILDILDRDANLDAVVLEISTGLRGGAWAKHEEQLTELLDRLAAFARRTAKTFGVVLHPAHLETLVARARQMAIERGLVVFASFERAAAAICTVAESAERRRRLAAQG